MGGDLRFREQLLKKTKVESTIVNVNKYTKAYRQVDDGGRGDEFKFRAEKRDKEICKN